MKPTYESPLASCYASKTMLHLFSPDMRYETWRRLWVALARAEHTLGLPITQAQVDELAAHVSPIDYDVVAAREKEVRHDVMAHIYAYGLAAPGAKGVIHLGATSCYVTDNADLILYREALRYLERELKAAMRKLCGLCRLRHIRPRSRNHRLPRARDQRRRLNSPRSPSRKLRSRLSRTGSPRPDWSTSRWS